MTAINEEETLPPTRTVVVDPAIEQRYGRTPGHRRRIRTIYIVAAIAAVAIVGAWVFWVGLGSASELETDDRGYVVQSNSEVTVSWQLTVDPGTTAACAVQAQNEGFGIVGWKVVQLPASDERSRVFTQTLRTSERAVTGLIYRCWTT
ncbi:DUF4307 domain-containing protein [Glaciihabitans sp. dw_435]|uniref:DUF4307 domain-containing protein n=1 Tax=Glaciihabitans sp. dw_435 TaxID=2720081 RepID=UPI0027DC9FB3|nr:DUF4307 domain-containing protein [Glaciihabitans sp. dw_435]